MFQPDGSTQKNSSVLILFYKNLGENQDLIYIGTFDGFDGNIASYKCVNQLHLGILQSLSNNGYEIKFDKKKFVYDEINNLEKFDKSIDQNSLANSRSLSKTSFKDEQSQNTKNSYYDLDLTNKSHQELTKDFSICTETFSENEKKNIKLFKNAFKYAHSQMDKLLSRGKGETSKLRWSGSTTCTCIIESKINEDGINGGWIHIANCGDIEAIVILDVSRSKLKHKRNFRLLTTLHDLNENVKEREKIETIGNILLIQLE